MEDVLDRYAAPPDPACPLVCFEERPVGLRRDACSGTPCASGCAARVDYEYVREGTGNLFVALAPHAGWRHVTVTARAATEVAAWQAPRNAARATVTWRFTTPLARTRLARLYPELPS